MSTLTTLFLIGLSSFLQVTSKTIKSLMGLKFGKIRPWPVELSALEGLEKLWEKCCEHSIAFIFGWIFIIFAGNKDNHTSLDEFELLQDPINHAK